MRRVDPHLPAGVKGGGVPRAAASLAGYYLFVFHGFLRFKSTRAARDSRPHGAGREPGGAAGGGRGAPREGSRAIAPRAAISLRAALVPAPCVPSRSVPAYSSSTARARKHAPSNHATGPYRAELVYEYYNSISISARARVPY